MHLKFIFKAESFTSFSKIGLAMRLTGFFLLVCLMQASAATFGQTVTLHKKDASLKEILKDVRAQTGYDFIYSNRTIRDIPTLTISGTNMDLKEVLEKALLEQGLTYSINKKVIVLKKEERPLSAEEEEIASEPERQITGTVVDSTSGEPLAGVTIRVQGTNNGTVTDGEGKFTLTADDNAVLEVSFVGYSNRIIRVNGRNSIEISLITSSFGLDQLVVVGYGTERKGDVTGSLSSIKYDSILANRPITDASQALAGKATGLWVSQNSGSPGDDGAQLRVRGWGTLNDASPLVIIDGIPGNFSDVNPNDIQDVSVLKDAASAAIYGSRAANGVILITTKSGDLNQKAQVSLSSYIGIQSLGRRYNIIENSAEYMTLWNQALANEGGDPIFPEGVIEDYQNTSDKYTHPNTDFYKELFKTTPITSHNLSLRGGTQNTRYYLSAKYLYQDGIILNTNSEKYNLTMNIDSKVNKWFSVGGRINGQQKKSKGPYDFGRILYMFSNGAYPFTAAYTKDGEFGAPEVFNPDGSIIVGNRNPLIETANGQDRIESSYYKMDANATITFTDYLNFKSNVSVQYNNDLEDKYNQLLYGYTSTGVQAINLDYKTTLEANRNDLDNKYIVWFNTLNFDKQISDKSKLGALLGMQNERTQIKNLFGRRSDPPIEGLTQIDAGTNGIQANGNEKELRILSYFGRINYSYDDKYLFETNFRADASSRFRNGKRWGYFPGVSVAWKINNENFMSNQTLFSDLKLRGSWGSLGNENINQYWPYLSTISQSFDLSYNFGGALDPGASVTALTNQDISWETSTTTDFGLDFGFLQNKILGSVDYFRKETKDIIVQLPIPMVLGGLTPPFQNIGKMLNKGFEASVSYSNLKSSRKEFSYSIEGNFTYIDNKVTKFRGGDSPDQLYLIREGYSYQELYGFKAIGIFHSDDEAKSYMANNGFLPQAGDLKLEDVNGDGKIDHNDKMALGNTIPKITYGLHFRVSYDGFDLTAQFRGIANAHAYTSNAWTQPLGISGGTITKRWANAWTEQNPDSNLPSIKINNTWGNQESSFWVSNISFLKAENVQLGYAFPKRITSSVGIKSLYVFLNAQNLFTVVNNDYEGFDPERSTFDSGDNYYPIPRIFSFGFNLDF